jgi:hypothetical protein
VDGERRHVLRPDHTPDRQRRAQLLAACFEPVAARLIWRTASPRWDFDDATFERSAASLDNPDHVAIVIHNYRWRIGLGDGEPPYDALERRLAEAPVIDVPTITLEGDANGAPHPDSGRRGDRHRVRDRSGEAPRRVRRRPAAAAGRRDGRDPAADRGAGLHRAGRAGRLEVAAVLGVVASQDKAAGTDVVRSMAERAGATITEVDGSHVIMVSQPDAVADVIKTAAAEVGRPVAATAG